MQIVELGASELDPDTNALTGQAKTTPVGDTEDDAPDYGKTPVACALGLTARWFPKTDEGAAFAVVDDNLPGQDGWIVGITDRRKASAGVVQQLAAGDTAVHSTGPDFDSITLHKKQLWAAMVGDDCAIVVDRENKRISISGFGLHWELSEANGACMFDATGAGIQINGGVVCITGQVVLGGRTPVQPVTMGPVGATAVGAPGVFIGA
jgi:hypothetical protein